MFIFKHAHHDRESVSEVHGVGNNQRYLIGKGVPSVWQVLLVIVFYL